MTTVEEFLVRCQPLEFIALVAVIVGAVVGLVGLMAWRQVRLKQTEAALKQEALRKGLSVAEIQQLLKPTLGLFVAKPRTDAEAIREVARGLTTMGTSGPDFEQCMALIQATDSATRLAVAEVSEGMIEEAWEYANKEQLVAIIRGLCVEARSDDSGNPDIRDIPAKPFATAVRPRD